MANYLLTALALANDNHYLSLRNVRNIIGDDLNRVLGAFKFFAN